ncbi:MULTISPECIES: patatin-like phospholipase family protein [Dyella]|nr:MULTISPECIES: patatin-like phospholipase family protein [Dyella]
MRWLLAAAVLLCPAWLAAEQAPVQPPSPAPMPSPCIGLVLGGGGARGAAHIGVLQVLEREHIPICRITGTSMGSIVGGLYAAGYNSTELESVIGTLDWKDLFSDDPARAIMPMRRKDADYRYLLNFEVGYKDGHIVTPTGLIQGQKLILLLRRLLLSTWDVHDFDKLNIPFRAVATDIVVGKPVVFSQGDLPVAIRSSMSVPGAFAPTVVDDTLLVDGGLMDNVPIDVIRTMGAQRLIVVDVGSPLDKREALNNPVAILNQMVSALMIEKTERQIATLTPNDVLIRPALGDITAAEFNRSAEAIAIGRAAAEAALPQLRAMAVSPEVWARYAANHRQRNFDPQLIAFLNVDINHTKTGEFVARTMSKEIGKPFDPKVTEQQIGNVYGRGSYQQIDYRLQQRDGDRGLLIIPNDKPWGGIYGKLGFQLDDDFDGRSEYLLSGEVTATNLNRYGAEWRNTVWMGRITGLRTEFYQPFGKFAETYIQPFAFGRKENVPAYDLEGDQELAEYRVSRRIVGIETGWSPTSYWRISATVQRGRDSGYLRIGNPTDFPDQTQQFASIGARINWDTLDSAQFPTRGVRFDLSYDSYRTFLGGDLKGDVARFNADWVPDWGLSNGRYHLLLGLRLSSALDDTRALETEQFLGGFLNLSGYPERALHGDQAALLRTIVYRRTGKLDAIFSTPIYIGASLEAGNAWRVKSDVNLNSLIFAGSIFAGLQSPLGPVFLGYGYAKGGHSSIYLTFGSMLRPSL